MADIVINTPAAKTKITYKPSSKARALLKNPAMGALLLARAKIIAARANGMYSAKGYNTRLKMGHERLRAYVYTSSIHAIRSNVAHDTLKKAVGSSKK